MAYLKLYKANDNIADTEFPSDMKPCILRDFTATYPRMGGAPEITAKLLWESDIDKLWNYDVYVELRGEKFFIKNIPQHTKQNKSHLYEYDLTFVSERSVLDGKYMVDAVRSDSNIDGYQSNNTNVVFMGDIHELAKRITSAMAYSGLDYSVVVDDGVTSSAVLVSFQDKTLSEAIAEGFSLYKIPYYFVGKVCHFGYCHYDFTTPLSYGSGNGLMMDKSDNSGQRIINRITGHGSSDNIPFYYPNNSPKGNISLELGASNVGLRNATIKDYRKFANKAKENEDISYRVYDAQVRLTSLSYGVAYGDARPLSWTSLNVNDPSFSRVELSRSQKVTAKLSFRVTGNAKARIRVILHLMQDDYECKDIPLDATIKYSTNKNNTVPLEYATYDSTVGNFFVADCDAPGYYDMEIYFSPFTESTVATYFPITGFYVSVALDDLHYLPDNGWVSDGKVYKLEDLGIESADTPKEGDTFCLKVDSKIPFSSYLMPPIYRESLGAERFYDALNNKYPIKDGDGFYEFENQYSVNKPSEYIDNNEKIKPTIVGTLNSEGQRIDVFSEFAYDLNDNDNSEATSESSEEFEHPYFYGKLKKFDGDYGFNLFDHAIENDEMVISMTSGVCGSCNFTIVVDANTQRNLVLVDDNGDLVRDADGNVMMASDGQGLDKQNNTRDNEVWVALKKDVSAYGQIMPNATYNHKPSVDDTFVILHIDLPESYVRKAENELLYHLIDSMVKRNIDTYNPSITFSQIFLNEESEYKDNLDENSRIPVVRGGVLRHYLIESLTYKYTSKSIIPDISVDVVEEFNSVSTNSASIVKAIEGALTHSVSISPLLNDRFFRKDVPDTSLHKPLFKSGLSFEGDITTQNFRKGDIDGAGLGLYEDSEGNTVIEADKLVVRKTAVFNELIINQIGFTLGETIFSNGGGEIVEVESRDDFIRCYFDVSNGQKRPGFMVGDQARCQRYSPSYAGITKYYWRVVLSVGDDYVDLAVDGTDDNGLSLVDGTDAPEVGDNLVQFGNRTDINRQSAIIIDPRNGGAVEVYSGINSFDLTAKNYVGMGVNPNTNRAYIYGYGDVFFGDRNLENQFITYQIPEGKTEPELHVKANITLGAGSTGLSNLSEFQEVQQTATDAGAIANAVKEQVDKEFLVWFYNVNPSILEEPWKDWTTQEIKELHISDYYFNYSAGTAWQFQRNSVFPTLITWFAITDSTIVDTLAKLYDAILTSPDIADKTRVSSNVIASLLSAQEAKDGVSDLQFLKNAFPDAVLDSEGVILSKLMAVKDGTGETANIVAGVYGGASDLLNENGYQDSEHGTLMMFAGAPNVGEVAESDFKVYEDGYVEARSGSFSGLIYHRTVIIDSKNFFDYFESTGVTNHYQSKGNVNLAGCNVVINDVQSDTPTGTVYISYFLINGDLTTSYDVRRQYLGATFTIAVRAKDVQVSVCSIGFCLSNPLVTGQVGYYTYALDESSDTESYTFNSTIKTLA